MVIECCSKVALFQYGPIAVAAQFRPCERSPAKKSWASDPLQTRLQKYSSLTGMAD